MALNISSHAPIISSKDRDICNFTGSITAGTEYSVTPDTDNMNAATFQNLSECWLRVRLNLDKAKDDSPAGEYCFVLAPGQVKNVHFHGEYFSDTNPTTVRVVAEPDTVNKVDCDAPYPDNLTDPDIVAYVDITFFRA